MAQLKSEAAYRAAMKRIEELLPLVNDNTPVDDPNYLELDMISDMVEESEPSLKTGRELSRQLNIDPAVVLGV